MKRSTSLLLSVMNCFRALNFFTCWIEWRSKRSDLYVKKRRKEDSECGHIFKNTKGIWSVLLEFPSRHYLSGFSSNSPSVKSPFLALLCVEISPIDAKDFLTCRKNPWRSSIVTDKLNKIEMCLIFAILTMCRGLSGMLYFHVLI